MCTAKKNGLQFPGLFPDVNTVCLHAFPWSSHAAKHMKVWVYLNFKHTCEKSVCHLLSITIKERKSMWMCDLQPKQAFNSRKEFERNQRNYWLKKANSKWVHTVWQAWFWEPNVGISGSVLHNKPMRQVLLSVSSLYRWGNLGAGRKVTCPRSMTTKQVASLPISGSLVSKPTLLIIVKCSLSWALANVPFYQVGKVQKLPACHQACSCAENVLSVFQNLCTLNG